MRPAGTLRRRGRVCALQILYQMDVAGELVGAVTARARARAAGQRFTDAFAEPDDDAPRLAVELVEGVAGDLLALDARIAEVSRNWRLARMAVVDRNLLRLAAFEMDAPRALPKAVAVNEAVEMARLFGGADSPSFVNAVLDRLAPGADRGPIGELGRAPREA